MAQETYVVDEIREVVRLTGEGLVKKNFLYQIYYMHGHPKEIISRLQAMTKTVSKQSKKYPIICLFQDFVEQRGAKPGFYGRTNLQLAIANITKPEYNAEQRYAENFKPVLYPIYNEFIYQLFRYPLFAFQSVEEVKHTKIDRLYWGSETSASKGNDYLDCIEIQNLDILIKQKIC